MTRARPDRPVRYHLAVDAGVVATGMVLLLAAASVVHRGAVSGAERAVFRALNTHTVVPFAAVWLPMQLGNFVAVPVVAGLAVVFRRWRLACGLLLGGAATYGLAKVVKGLVPRGRPAAELHDVVIRGAPAVGRGFVSGHAAVVTFMLVLAWPYLGRAARCVAVALAVVVCLARVYVGAHLPLDVVGGVGLGLATAGAVQVLIGRPRREPHRPRIRDAETSGAG